jgi:uncharacterized RDD family membrane protein YckC
MSNPVLFVKRIIAIIIDSVILGVIGGIIGAVAGQELGGLVSFAIGVVYTWFFLTRNNGQTPGKMVLGIRVVAADGGSINDLQAILRYVGYYVNTLLCFVGWIYAFFNTEQRGFHDMIAGTRVVE